MIITKPANYSPDDYERLEVLTSAVKKLTAAKHTKNGKIAKAVLITCETNILRWRDDGDPTTGASGNGSPIPIGGSMLLTNSKSIKNIGFIGLSGTGYVHVHYYR